MLKCYCGAKATSKEIAPYGAKKGLPTLSNGGKKSLSDNKEIDEGDKLR